MAEISNDPEMEKLGANKAALYAAEYWSRLATAARTDALSLDALWDEWSSLTTMGPQLDPKNGNASATQTSKLTFTTYKADSMLYARFKSNFAAMDLSLVGDDPGASSLHTDTWRSLLIASEGTVPDFSFMSLIRCSALSPFYMTQQTCCPGVVICPRAQFLFIEIARCREHYYGKAFRRMLALFELKTFAMRLSAAETDLDVKAVSEIMQAQYPLPHKKAISTSGAGKALRRACARFPSAIGAAGLLERWRHGVELGEVRPHLTLLDSQVVTLDLHSFCFSLRSA